MTTRTIDDPSALGWVQDPSTGRWVWQSSSGGGGEGGTSGPVSTSMVATEGQTCCPWLADPSELRTQKDVNRYLNEKIDTFQETDPTVPDHVKAITNSQIASWDAGTGGGGGSGPTLASPTPRSATGTRRTAGATGGPGQAAAAALLPTAPSLVR